MDLVSVYSGLVARAAGGTPLGSALDGLVLPPGVYTSPSYLVNGAKLTFDARGDSSSVWIIVRWAELHVCIVCVSPRSLGSIYFCAAARPTSPRALALRWFS